MIKNTLALSLLLCLASQPLISNASSQTSDPLQIYRDEIKQTESHASATVLDQLGPSINDSNPYQSAPPSQTSTPAAPPSNTERAFSPPVETQKNVSPQARGQSNTNPWEKPNPWAAQSKVNPWANAPIPGPTPSTPKAVTPISPPNIFAPAQPANIAKKPTNQSNPITY
jgi:hypothetical protein